MVNKVFSAQNRQSDNPFYFNSIDVESCLRHILERLESACQTGDSTKVLATLRYTRDCVAQIDRANKNETKAR